MKGYEFSFIFKNPRWGGVVDHRIFVIDSTCKMTDFFLESFGSALQELPDLEELNIDMDKYTLTYIAISTYSELASTTQNFLIRD